MYTRCNSCAFCFLVINDIPTISTHYDDLIIDDDPPETRIIQTLDALCSAFMIARQSSIRKHLPSYATRADINTWTDETSQSAKQSRKSVVNLYIAVLHSVSEIVCGHEAAKKSLFELAKTFTQSYDTIPASNVQTQSLIQVIANSKKSSIEKRVSRALLTTSLTRKEINRQISSNFNFQFNWKTYSRARKDVTQLLDGQPLEITARSLQRYNPAAVDVAIAFILSHENVSFLSWGTKSISVDGTVHTFPKIIRKRTKTRIFKCYETVTSLEQRLPRCIFFRIVSILTHSDNQLRTAVDYVTTTLVNDNFSVVKRIAQHFITAPAEREAYEQELEIARRHLKYGLDRTIDKTNCVIHCTGYGLNLPKRQKKTNDSVSPEAPSSTTAIASASDEPWNLTPDSDVPTCNDCKHLLYVFKHLENKINVFPQPNVSAKMALAETVRKTKLFAGHKMRVVNQQRGNAKAVEDMKARCLLLGYCDECIITIDWKMKWEQLWLRESTTAFFGKRGISWHGAMILYCTIEYIDGVKTAVLQRVYMDHILENENKQDRTAVAAVLEAVIIGNQILIRFITLPSLIFFF